MKKLMSLALAVLMTLQAVSLTTTTVSAQQLASALKTAQDKLTNKDVIDMQKGGMSEAIIIAKINSSETSFDTSPSALQELKTAGLSDAVILAMVQPGKKTPAVVETAAPAPNTFSASAPEILIADGTEIEIELKNNLSGEEAKMGDVVDFTVVRPIQVNGVTVIEQGASAKGRITNAKKAGRWGKTGKLEWAMSDVGTVSGTRIPVRFTKAMTGGSKGGTVAVAAVATTVLLGPVGLLWGLKKGKKAEIPAGNKYSIYVDGNSTLKMTNATASLPK